MESALVTWFGLLLYEISSLAPTGHISVRSHTLHYQLLLLNSPLNLYRAILTSATSWFALHRSFSSVHSSYYETHVHWLIAPDNQGISQCLITARLVLTKTEGTYVRGTFGQLTAGYTERSSAAQTGNRSSRIQPMTFKVPEMSEIDSMDESTVEATKTESTILEQDSAVVHAV